MRPERRANVFLAVAVLGLAALLQATLAPAALGARIDLVLLPVVVWSVMRGKDEAIVWGLIGGAFVDLFSAAPFGTSVLALGAVAVGVSWIGDLFRRSRLAAVLVLTPLSTVAFHLLLALILERLGWRIDYPATVALLVLPSCLINALLAPFVYAGLRLVAARSTPMTRLA